MFTYTICAEANKSIFLKQCAALEKRLLGLEKEKLLQDVDSTLIQTYFLNGDEIMVYNDMNIGAVYIKSKVDLTKYFS